MSRSWVVVVAGLIVACSTQLPPVTSGLGLNIASTFAPDTIDARSLTELEVIVYDSTGRRLQAATVTFKPENMFVAGLSTEPPWVNQAARATDSDGSVRIRVKRGDHTPAGQIIVTVTDASGRSATDTVVFTILPGHAAGGHVARPADTSLYIGGSLPISAGGLDRNGNLVPLATTLASSGGLVASGDGTVTATDYGRSFVVATTAAGTDTAFISVVPHGVLLASRTYPSYSMDIVELDGSRRDPAPWTPQLYDDEGSWTPDGKHFLVSEDLGYLSLQIVDLQGNYHRVGPDSLAVIDRPWFTADGSALFFALPSTVNTGCGARIRMDQIRSRRCHPFISPAKRCRRPMAASSRPTPPMTTSAYSPSPTVLPGRGLTRRSGHAGHPMAYGSRCTSTVWRRGSSSMQQPVSNGWNSGTTCPESGRLTVSGS